MGVSLPTVRFITTSYAPPERVTLRTSSNNWSDVEGQYDNVRKEWEFVLPPEQFPANTEFKLMLNGSRWMDRYPNPLLSDCPNLECVFQEKEITFQAESGATMSTADIGGQPIWTQPAFWVTVITDVLAIAAFIATTAGKPFPAIPDAIINSAAFLIAAVVSGFFVHGQQQITKARMALAFARQNAGSVPSGAPAINVNL
jgi:hypothetical protein